jgi:diguanylate cyclase (GGDEF)-like protein
MVTAVVAAAAVAAVLVVAAALMARWAGARSQRRFEAVVGQLDVHMEAISQNLQRAVERSDDARGRSLGDFGLTLDLADLLQRLVEEAATRTGAQAATVRVRGAGEMSAVASFGTGDGAALLEASLGPPDARPFRALTLNWTYGQALEGDDVSYRSGLVVPIIEDGVETGALATYARGAAAFRPEHARALLALADDAAPGITNARRFAEAELRAVTDGLTGVRNRRGYDEELERELARARRTARPLSLLLLDLDNFAEINARFDYPGGDLVLQEFADLLERAARATDTVCRRGGEEFGILLPETTGDEARQFHVRLRDEVAATGFSNVGRLTFSAGLVEWRPNESRESLDARVSAAVNRAKRAGKDRLEADWP